jgi:phosphate transport system permease protein
MDQEIKASITVRAESSFTAESLRKKFRFSEFFAEKLITLIAFMSIAIIILIFVFVFRESLPIFSQGESVRKQTETKADEPERYGSDNSGAVLNPETYTPGDLQPEQYGQESLSPERYDGGDLQPERYGVSEDTTGETAQKETILLGRRDDAGGNEKIGIKNLSGRDWQPVSDNPRYGLIPLLLGTLKITLISILLAAPIAILAALFSASFAAKWLREIIKPVVELLAGFPSVVVGFFALMVMATFFQDLFGYSSRLNAFVGGVAMALAAIPVIFTVTEDVMTAVPASYKEASLALGATKWQTAFFVVLPAATPGIFAAVLLGIGRIFGETMIALMATGNAAMISANPFESVRTLAATIGAEMAEVVFGDIHYSVLFLIGSLLFIFTFSLNAVAEFYVKGRLMRRFQGKTS